METFMLTYQHAHRTHTHNILDSDNTLFILVETKRSSLPYLLNHTFAPHNPHKYTPHSLASIMPLTEKNNRYMLLLSILNHHSFRRNVPFKQ